MDEDELYGQAFSVPDLTTLIRSQNPSKPSAERKSVRERKKAVTTNIQTFETTMRKGKADAGKSSESDSANPGADAAGTGRQLTKMAGRQRAKGARDGPQVSAVPVAIADAAGSKGGPVLKLKLSKKAQAPVEKEKEQDVSALFDDGLYGDALRAVVQTSAPAPSFALPDLVPPPRHGAGRGASTAGAGLGFRQADSSLTFAGPYSTQAAAAPNELSMAGVALGTATSSAAAFPAFPTAGQASGRAADASIPPSGTRHTMRPSRAQSLGYEEPRDPFSDFSALGSSQGLGTARTHPLLPSSTSAGVLHSGPLVGPHRLPGRAAQPVYDEASSAEYSMYGGNGHQHQSSSGAFEGMEYSMAGLESGRGIGASSFFGSPVRPLSPLKTQYRRLPLSPLAVGSVAQPRVSPPRYKAVDSILGQDGADTPRGSSSINVALATSEAAVLPGVRVGVGMNTGERGGHVAGGSTPNIIRLPGRIETSGQRKAGKSSGSSPASAVAAPAAASVLPSDKIAKGTTETSEVVHAANSGTGRGQAASANGSKHSKGSGKVTVGSAELPSHALHATVLAAKKHLGGAKKGSASRKQIEASEGATTRAPAAAVTFAVNQDRTEDRLQTGSLTGGDGGQVNTRAGQTTAPTAAAPAFSASKEASKEQEEDEEDDDVDDDDFDLPSDDDDLWRDSGSDVSSGESEDEEAAMDGADDDNRSRTDDGQTGSRSGVTSSDIARTAASAAGGGSGAGRADTQAARAAAGSRSGRSHGTRSTRDTGDTGESGEFERDGGSDLESIDRRELRDLMIDAHRPLQELLDDMWRDELDPYFPGPGMGASVLPSAAGTGGTGRSRGASAVRQGPGSPSTMSVSARSLGARSLGALSFGARSLGGRSLGGMSLGGMSVASIGGLTTYLGLPSTKSRSCTRAGTGDSAGRLGVSAVPVPVPGLAATTNSSMEGGGIDHSALSAVSSHALHQQALLTDDAGQAALLGWGVPGVRGTRPAQEGPRPGYGPGSPPRPSRLSARAAARAHLTGATSQGASLIPDLKRPGAFLLTGWPGFEGREPPRLFFSELPGSSAQSSTAASSVAKGQADAQASEQDDARVSEPDGLAARAAQRARARKAKGANVPRADTSQGHGQGPPLLHQPSAETIAAMLSKATVLQLPSVRAGSAAAPPLSHTVDENGPFLAWLAQDGEHLGLPTTSGGLHYSTRQPKRKGGKQGAEDEEAVQARAMEGLTVAAAQLGLSVIVDYGHHSEQQHEGAYIEGQEREGSRKRAKGRSKVADESASAGDAVVKTDREGVRDGHCASPLASSSSSVQPTSSQTGPEQHEADAVIDEPDAAEQSSRNEEGSASLASEGLGKGESSITSSATRASRPARDSVSKQEAIRAKVTALRAKVSAAALAGQSARAAISKTAPLAVEGPGWGSAGLVTGSAVPLVAENPVQAAEAIQQLLQAGPWLLQGTANSGIEGCTVYDVNRSSGSLCLVLELSRIRTEDDGYRDGLRFSGTVDGAAYTPLPGPAAALQAISVGSKYAPTLVHVNTDGEVVQGPPPAPAVAPGPGAGASASARAVGVGGDLGTELEADGEDGATASTASALTSVSLQQEGPLCRVVPCWERPTWAHLLHARIPSVLHLSPFALAWDGRSDGRNRQDPVAQDAQGSAQMGLYPCMADALTLLHPQPVRQLHPAAMPAAPAHYAYFTHTQYKALLAQVQQLTSLLLSALVHATNPETGKGDSDCASRLVTMVLDLLSLRQAAEQLRAKDTAGKVDSEETVSSTGAGASVARASDMVGGGVGAGGDGTGAGAGSTVTSQSQGGQVATGVSSASMSAFMPVPAVPVPPPSIRNGRMTRLAISTAQKAFQQYGSWALTSIPTDEAILLPPSVFQAPMLSDGMTGRILASVMQWQALHSRVKDSLAQAQRQDVRRQFTESTVHLGQGASASVAEDASVAGVAEGGSDATGPDSRVHHALHAVHTTIGGKKRRQTEPADSGPASERIFRPKRQRKMTARLVDDSTDDASGSKAMSAVTTGGAASELLDGCKERNQPTQALLDRASHLSEALAPLVGPRLQAAREQQAATGQQAPGAPDLGGSDHASRSTAPSSFGSPSRTTSKSHTGSYPAAEHSMVGYDHNGAAYSQVSIGRPVGPLGPLGPPMVAGSGSPARPADAFSEYSMLGTGMGTIAPPPPLLAEFGEEFDLLADLYTSYMLPPPYVASAAARGTAMAVEAQTGIEAGSMMRDFGNEPSLSGMPLGIRLVEGSRLPVSDQSRVGAGIGGDQGSAASVGEVGKAFVSPTRRQEADKKNTAPVTAFGMPTTFGSPSRSRAMVAVSSAAPSKGMPPQSPGVPSRKDIPAAAAPAPASIPVVHASEVTATVPAAAKVKSKSQFSHGSSTNSTSSRHAQVESMTARTGAHEAHLHMIYASAGNLLLSEIARMGAACGVPMIFTLPSITLPGVLAQGQAGAGGTVPAQPHAASRKAGSGMEDEADPAPSSGGTGTGGSPIRFIPEEDILIFLGLLKYGPRDINMIRARLLPNKTYTQIQARVRNLCTRRKFRPVSHSYKLLSSVRRMVGAPALVQPTAPPVLSNTASKCSSSELYIGLEGASASLQAETLSCLPSLCQGYAFTPDQQASAMVELALQVGTGRLVHEAENCLTAGAVLPFDFSAGERALLKAACDVYGVSTRSFHFMSQAVLPHRGPELLRIFYAQYVMERAMENLLAPNMTRLSAALASVLALGPVPTVPHMSSPDDAEGDHPPDASVAGVQAPEAPQEQHDGSSAVYAVESGAADTAGGRPGDSGAAGLIGLQTLADATGNNAMLLSDIFGAAAAAAAASDDGMNEDGGEAGGEGEDSKEDDRDSPGGDDENEAGRPGRRRKRSRTAKDASDESEWAVAVSTSKGRSKDSGRARVQPDRVSGRSAGPTTGVSSSTTRTSSKQAAVDPFALIDDTTMLCRSLFPELRWIPGDGAYRGPQRPHLLHDHSAPMGSHTPPPPSLSSTSGTSASEGDVGRKPSSRPLPSYLCMLLAGLCPRPEDVPADGAAPVPQSAHSLYMPPSHHPMHAGAMSSARGRVFVHRPQPGQDSAASGLDNLAVAPTGAEGCSDGPQAEVQAVANGIPSSPHRSHKGNGGLYGISNTSGLPSRASPARRAGLTPPRWTSRTKGRGGTLGRSEEPPPEGHSQQADAQRGTAAYPGAASGGQEGVQKARVVRWHDEVDTARHPAPAPGAGGDPERRHEEEARSNGSGLPFTGAAGTGASLWHTDDAGVSNRQSELLRSLLALANAPPVGTNGSTAGAGTS